MNNMELYHNAINRINRDGKITLEQVVVELEKEINSYREKIDLMQKQFSNDNLTWFRVDQNVNSKELHKFLLAYVPMGEVLNLYKLLKKSMEV